MKIILAQPRGFCAGVERAIEIVERALEVHGAPIYVRHEIVHNKYVVNTLKQKGSIFVNEIDEVPDGSVLIFSAHGVPKKVAEKAASRDLVIYDATCPLVRKVHAEVSKMHKAGYEIIMIGHVGHPEVEGIKGWSSRPEETTVIFTGEEAEKFTLKGKKRVCIVSQTTFNNKKFKELVEIIQKKGYDIIVLNTICNATQERQAEAKEISRQVDAMIVVGGKNSSNTQKLFEICKKECENTCYIQTLEDLDLSKLRSINSVGITAGASTPNKIIEEVQKNVRNEF